MGWTSPEKRWEGVGIFIGAAGIFMAIEITSQLGPLCLAVGGVIYISSVIKHRKIESFALWRAIGAIVIFGGLVIWFEGKITEKKLEATQGLLEPEGKESPPSVCTVPKGDFGVYLANGAYIAQGKQSIVGEIYPDRSVKQELLSVSWEGSGLAIDARVFDDRQNLVAKIEHNHFIQTPFAAYYKKPNLSTFIVYDHLDQEVLNIELLNENAVIVNRLNTYTSDGKHHVQIDGKVMLADDKLDARNICYFKMRNIIAFMADARPQ